MHSPSTWSQSSPMVGHGLTLNVVEEEPQNGLAKGLVFESSIHAIQRERFERSETALGRSNRRKKNQEIMNSKTTRR